MFLLCEISMKLGLLAFRLKCLFWIPFYFIIRLSKNYSLVIREMRIWENQLIIAKYKSDFLQFLRMMALFEEFRSLVEFRTGIPIPFKQNIYFFSKSCDIGEGLIIQHGFSTVVFAESMGTNCQVWQNVTIGRNGMNRSPRIGNHVKVCANSCVIGDIEIGDNVIIGAGCVVTKNVPSDTTVVGNPARIVKRNGIRVDEKL